MSGTIFSLVAIIATIIGFAVEIAWGWRVMGTFMILAGLWTFWKRPTKYGIDGRAFSGQLTGWAAIFAAMTNVAIGALLIANSKNLAAWVAGVIRDS
jgi:hypothetical protein